MARGRTLGDGFTMRRASLLTAEKLREIATRQGVVPFLSGDLRKSHVVQPTTAGARVGSNLPYARAVHDGRPALTIRPRKAKALFFPGLDNPVAAVRQPARDGKPWLRDSVETLRAEGTDFLIPWLGPEAAREIADHLRNAGLPVKVKT